MRKIALLAPLLPLSLFGVLDIKPVDIGNNPGFSAKVAATLQTTRGNVEKDIYSGETKLQYDNNTTDVIWLQLHTTYAKASDKEYINRATAHLRNIYALNTQKNFCFESYLQIQQDKFKSINDRDLTGLGLRYTQNLKSYGKFYFGLGGYYEYLNYLDKVQNPNEYNTRVSSYFAYSVALHEDATLSYLGYFQPKVDALSDYYTSQKLSLSLVVYKQLSLEFNIAYASDSKPAVAVKEYDFTQVTSFVYSF